MIKFAQRLKELRIDKNLSQAQLAKKLGVKHYVVSDWEARDKRPAWEMLINIASFFNVSIDYLIGHKDY